MTPSSRVQILEGSYNRNSWSAGLSTGSSFVTETAGLAATFAIKGAALSIACCAGDRMNKRAKRKREKREVLRRHINMTRTARSVAGCRCVQRSTPGAACAHIDLGWTGDESCRLQNLNDVTAHVTKRIRRGTRQDMSGFSPGYECRYAPSADMCPEACRGHL